MFAKIRKIFNDRNTKMKKMQKLVKKVNSLAPQYKGYTDDELKNEILSFKGK